MPLFAYRCSDCAHQFETLSRFDEIPECPACGGAHVERQLSLIARPAAGGESRRAAPRWRAVRPVRVARR